MLLRSQISTITIILSHSLSIKLAVNYIHTHVPHFFENVPELCGISQILHEKQITELCPVSQDLRSPPLAVPPDRLIILGKKVPPSILYQLLQHSADSYRLATVEWNLGMQCMYNVYSWMKPRHACITKLINIVKWIKFLPWACLITSPLFAPTALLKLAAWSSITRGNNDFHHLVYACVKIIVIFYKSSAWLQYMCS